MIEDDVILNRVDGHWMIHRGTRSGDVIHGTPFARVLDALVDGMLISDPAERRAPPTTVADVLVRRATQAVDQADGNEGPQCPVCHEYRDDLDDVTVSHVDDDDRPLATGRQSMCTDCRRELLGLPRTGDRQYPEARPQ